MQKFLVLTLCLLLNIDSRRVYYKQVSVDRTYGVTYSVMELMTLIATPLYSSPSDPFILPSISYDDHHVVCA